MPLPWDFPWVLPARMLGRGMGGIADEELEELALALDGRLYPVPPGTTLRIGRGPECEIWLDTPSVSRQHAIVTNAGGRLFVEDRGSRNGVFVNGDKITGPRALELGQRILIGDRFLRVVEAMPTAVGVPSAAEVRAQRPPLVVSLSTGTVNVHAATIDGLRSALGEGRTERATQQAERLCAGLASVVDRASVEPGTLEEATRELIRLAERTADARWLDELLRVRRHLHAALDARTTDRVAAWIEALPPSSDVGRRAYIGWVQTQPLRFTDRVALKRLLEASPRRR